MPPSLHCYSLTKGKLPTGSPTSPVISNFICLQLDADLQAFADKYELTYTRYADDLTFSSDAKITSERIEELKTIIATNRFEINQKKFRIANNNRRQTVTGLTVNNKINVNRKFLKNTRAMLFNLGYSGLTNAAKKHYKLEELTDENLKGKFLLKLRGSIDFIGQIRGREDVIYLKLSEEFDKHKSLVLHYEFNHSNIEENRISEI